MRRKGPNPVDKHVGNRVRMRRLMLHVTQERLAEALGITFQQVQKYEKGVNRISASRLQQISDILQAPVPFFFEGAPDSEAEGRTGVANGITAFLATTDGLALVKAYVQIRRPKLRRIIVDMVEQLTGR